VITFNVEEGGAQWD